MYNKKRKKNNVLITHVAEVLDGLGEAQLDGHDGAPVQLLPGQGDVRLALPGVVLGRRQQADRRVALGQLLDQLRKVLLPRGENRRSVKIGEVCG